MIIIFIHHCHHYHHYYHHHLYRHLYHHHHHHHKVKPFDYFVPNLGLSYCKCGNGLQGLGISNDFVPVIASEEVDDSVQCAIKTMINSSLTVIGPHLYKGILIISFFENRSSKGFFGLVNNNEKIVFERWKIPILVNENVIPNNTMNNASLSIVPAPEILLAREQIQLRILYIIDAASYVDHIPPSLYEYEIDAGITGEQKIEQSMVARLINSPSLLSNL
jgi:hypothetical protein